MTAAPTSSPKRVLFVSQMLPYLPCRDGFRIIPAHLLLRLSREHDVHLLALAGGEEDAKERVWADAYASRVETFPAAGELSLTRSRGAEAETPLEHRFRELLDELRPDVLHIEGTGLAPLARLVPSESRVTKLLSAHDSLSLRYRGFARHGGLGSRLRHRALALLARRFERRWCALFDHIIVTSESDRRAIRGAAAQARVSVVPNGVDLDFFRFEPKPTEGELVFTGNMGWRPNEDAAAHFATAVLPRLRAERGDVRFTIVGADPSPGVRALGNLPGVRVTGTVPDIRPWVWSAAAYVGPLRFGAGVKNKILEAMALGAPVVASSASFTGTPVVDGEHARVANTPQEFTDVLLELLSDDAARRRLSRAGRELVESTYTWDAVAARFASLYAERGPDSAGSARA